MYYNDHYGDTDLFKDVMRILKIFLLTESENISHKHDITLEFTICENDICLKTMTYNHYCGATQNRQRKQNEETAKIRWSKMRDEWYQCRNDIKEILTNISKNTTRTISDSDGEYNVNYINFTITKHGYGIHVLFRDIIDKEKNIIFTDSARFFAYPAFTDFSDLPVYGVKVMAMLNDKKFSPDKYIQLNLRNTSLVDHPNLEYPFSEKSIVYVPDHRYYKVWNNLINIIYNVVPFDNNFRNPVKVFVSNHDRTFPNGEEASILITTLEWFNALTSQYHYKNIQIEDDAALTLESINAIDPIHEDCLVHCYPDGENNIIAVVQFPYGYIVFDLDCNPLSKEHLYIHKPNN